MGWARQTQTLAWCDSRGAYTLCEKAKGGAHSSFLPRSLWLGSTRCWHLQVHIWSSKRYVGAAVWRVACIIDSIYARMMASPTARINPLRLSRDTRRPEGSSSFHSPFTPILHAGLGGVLVSLVPRQGLGRDYAAIVPYAHACFHNRSPWTKWAPAPTHSVRLCIDSKTPFLSIVSGYDTGAVTVSYTCVGEYELSALSSHFLKTWKWNSLILTT